MICLGPSIGPELGKKYARWDPFKASYPCIIIHCPSWAIFIKIYEASSLLMPTIMFLLWYSLNVENKHHEGFEGLPKIKWCGKLQKMAPIL